jgi:hypothetical protein
MPYINNDGDSRVNNFPTEPVMYTAEPASPTQKRNVAIVSVVGLLLVVGMVVVASSVS